jgi:hypothetical protein
MKYSLIFALILSAFQAQAQAPKHGYTPEQERFMVQHNQTAKAFDFFNGLFRWDKQASAASMERVPFAEYHDVGYVMFNDSGEYNSLAAKKLIAKNLPPDVTLVVFTANSDKSYLDRVYSVFSREMGSGERLRIVHLPHDPVTVQGQTVLPNSFWARDGIPVPAWSFDKYGNKVFTVVDAKYYHYFEADEEVSQLFGAELVSHNYYHEGGNFLANSRGDCLVVDNVRAAQIPDDVFLVKYGCKKTIRFPHTKGIGHIDETVKLINDDLALTDDEPYADILRANGFQVMMVPRPELPYETYVNSLYVNGTLFLPTFQEAGDAEAVALYESFGYKVVSLNSKQLSNDGLGSIHCITMAYPPVPFNELLANVGGREVTPK